MTEPSGPPGGPSNPPKDEPRNIRQAAAEIGCSVSWLYKRTAARSIPFVRAGGIKFYDKEIADIKAIFRVEPKVVRRRAA